VEYRTYSTIKNLDTQEVIFPLAGQGDG